MSLFSGERPVLARDHKVGSAAPRFVVTRELAAASVDEFIFIAPRKYRVKSIKEVHSVAGGAAAAVRPRKITADSQAPGAAAGASVIELNTANIDLTASANVVRTSTLVSNDESLKLAAGDRLALDFSGTLTGLVGAIVIELEEI